MGDRFISENLIKDLLKFIKEKSCIYCGADTIELNGEYCEIYGINEILKFLLGQQDIEEFEKWRNKGGGR